MLAIHITTTPLAGAPIRIVNALNSHTQITARLINLNPLSYGRRTFPEDLNWDKDRNTCLELIKTADILHFHHYFDVESTDNPFGFNFKQNASPKCKFIRHFHSCIDFIAKSKAQKKAILADKYPKLVIPHYPERYLLKAPIIPNIVPIHDNLFLPAENLGNNKVKVLFSASMLNSCWTARWNTKGYPEISKKLKKLSNKLNFEYIEAVGISFEECQKLKQQCDIVIGDIITGSYHLTELEALAQGKIVLSFLDNRTQMTLQNLTGAKDIPIVNTRLEELKATLKELIADTNLRREISQMSRTWMEKYYDDKNLIQILNDIYEKLIVGEPIERAGSADFPTAKDFLYCRINDIKWQVNRKRSFNIIKKFNLISRYWIYKIFAALTTGSLRRKFKEKMRLNRITEY